MPVKELSAEMRFITEDEHSTVVSMT